MFPCELCKISKNTFLHRTPPVAASERSTAGIFSGEICPSIKPVLHPDVFWYCLNGIGNQKKFS